MSPSPQKSSDPFEDALIERLTESTELDFRGDSWEGIFLRSAVSIVANVLPGSIRNFILDASDGLDDAEIERLIDVLTLVVDDRINIPRVPDFAEATIFRAVISGIMEMAKRGFSAHVPR